MNQKTFGEVFGWYGTIAIIGAYALISFNVTDANNLMYQLLNITGAAGIVFISMQKKTYQPAVLNMIWFVIAAAAILRIVFFH